AHDEVNVRERALQAGGGAFFRQPLNDEVFIKTFNEAVQRGAGDYHGGKSPMIFFGEKGERTESSSLFYTASQYFYWVWPVLLFIIVFIPLSGCTVYQPVPTYVPAPSTFDRAWSAAVGAAQDEGVRITSEDRVRGVISGSRGEQDVTIIVQTQ